MNRALLIALCLSGGAASAAPSQQVLDKIDAAAKDSHSLSATFTQKNRMKLFRQELGQKGRLYFRAPRQIRWEYTQPDASLLVLDGMKATMSSPGAAPQVFDLDKDATMRAIFDQLLTFVGGGSIAQAQAAYDIETPGNPSEPTLQLTPKAGGAIAKAFMKITLAFDKKTQVRKITLVERNGDEKEITFDKLDKNGRLPADAFSAGK